MNKHNLFIARHIKGCLLLLCTLLFSSIPLSAQADYGLALGYQSKYTKGFTHFAYINPQAPVGGQITFGITGTFDTLNPFALKGAPAQDLMPLVYETLLESSLDEPFSKYGLLAINTQLAPDGLSVLFTLNPAARFSDDSPVLAHDVKYSFDTLTQNPDANPAYRFYYADIKQAVVLGPRVVRFDFVRKNPELHLIIGDLPIISQKWGMAAPFKQWGMRAPVGSGPYTIARYTLGDRVVYERRANYWGWQLPVRKGTFNFKQVGYRFYKDATIRLEAFKAGQFDISHENSSKQWAKGYTGPKFKTGQIIKTELTHQNPNGMQGFGLNLRRAKFKDKRVRQALNLAFDFEWSNKNLFYGQYYRVNSYFSNSDMAAIAAPTADELALLEPYRKQLDPQVFGAMPPPVQTTPPHSLRGNLLQARELLRQAGWMYKDGKLRNAKGEPLVIELLLNTKLFERVAAPYARNLEKLGITLETRLVDTSLYQRRTETFDFDMMVVGYGVSPSPGNEQRNNFGSAAADQPSSQNVMGIKNPVVDALIEKIASAPNRQALVAACRALDRVLMSEAYLIPHFSNKTHRVAYWSRFNHLKTLPLYYTPLDWALRTWWAK